MTAPTYTLTPEDGRKGALAAAATKKTKAIARRTKAEAVWHLVDETDDLSPRALAAALTLIERLSSDPDADPLAVLRLANAAEVVHRISRLASGQSTSNVAHANMTDDERRERMAQLRAMGTSEVVATTTSDTPSPTTE